MKPLGRLGPLKPRQRGESLVAHVESTLELTTDALGVVNKLSQDDEYGCPSSPSQTLAERYCRGDLSLHVHLRCRGRDNNLSEYCIRFQRNVRKRADRELRNGSSARKDPYNVATLGYCGDHSKEFVLIGHVECLEGPRRRPRRVRSVIRLQLRNECLSFARETSNAFLEISPVAVSCEIDREHRLPVSGIGARQFPGDIVESGPQVMNAVADEQGPLDSWNRRRIDQAREIAMALTAGFDGNRILVSSKEVRDVAFERIEMTLRPVDLCSTTDEIRRALGLSHGVYSAYEEKTAHAERRGDSGAEAQRLSPRPEESHRARKITPQTPPEEVGSKTKPARRRGGYSATRTRSGSP